MSPPGTSKLPRVLLIDDDVISREVISMTLEMHGYPVDSAEDGAQALEFLSRANASAADVAPDVILMDAQMPGLSGVGLIEALRKSSNARIIAISGSANDRVRESADGFLLKPVDPAALEEVLGTQEQSGAQNHGLTLQATADLPEDADNNTEAAGRVAEHVIDPVMLKKLRAMMPDSAVREIYMATAMDLASRLVTLSAAMSQGRASEVARVAHAIKGGCAMVGLSGARDSAARLEISNQPENWQNELTQLHFALDKLQGLLSDGLLW
ncbi:response regulator [Acidicapsa dinghuensis]|uniref:Response regulator n=1 Tax=Acidicapsa dinghuensis TaxID=2218256 RepID=A0ABW1EBE2_9BACT|nr:hybrid sensor histidine kinase/response regulator [Acidicapsa dinghuensis]